jgi:uncharacterized protein YydD (DUF2326 family)
MSVEDRVSYLERRQEKTEGDIDRLWKEITTQFSEFNRTLHSIDLHLAESNLGTLKKEQESLKGEIAELKTQIESMRTGVVYRDIALFGLWAVIIPAGFGVAHLIQEMWGRLP